MPTLNIADLQTAHVDMTITELLNRLMDLPPAAEWTDEQEADFYAIANTLEDRLPAITPVMDEWADNPAGRTHVEALIAAATDAARPTIHAILTTKTAAAVLLSDGTVIPTPPTNRADPFQYAIAEGIVDNTHEARQRVQYIETTPKWLATRKVYRPA